VVLAREHTPLGIRQCGCDGVGGLGHSGKGLVSGVDDDGNSDSGPAAAPVGIGLDVGLDGDQWWAHARDTVESTMAFFVGVSRAAERLIFTQCDQRGSTDGIADLYEVLNQANVPFVRMD
jgi:hypothetical protein